MSRELPEALCLRLHRAYLRLRYLAPGLALLRCDACEAFR
jgi:hypothetical protein